MTLLHLTGALAVVWLDVDACDGIYELPAGREAGGWKMVATLKSAYQRADAETILRVVMEPVQLREVR